MKEQFSTPHNPSEAFAKQSTQEYAGRHESVLENEAAAYAAKPWMDVAVDLHTAKNRADWIEDGESVYDYSEQGSLDNLTAYAEKRAHQAVNGERNDTLTPLEERMLDAYKAEAEMAQAESKMDTGSLSAEQIDMAWDMAKDRAKAARQAGNMAEMNKWDKLASRAQEFNELFFAENLDEDERTVLDRKLRPNAGEAGYVLDMLDTDGATMRGTDSDRQKYVNQATVDAKNMRETAALYELFAEAQAQPAVQSEAPKGVPQSELNDMLKKQHELVAEQEADFAGQVDPDVLSYANFSDADKQIRAAMKAARGAGDEGALKKWQGLYRGMNEYRDAYIQDEQNKLPDDVTALMRRRDFMQFLASVNPQEQQAPAPDNKRQERPVEVEYNPDDTILPTAEEGRRSRSRMNFANNYFSDQLHQQFTPESIKLLKDYMVHELRGEIGYASRQGMRVSGGQQTLFNAVFTLADLNRKDRAVNKFAYQLVAHNADRPDLKYAEFEQMSMKDVAQAIGFDITKYVEDYDKRVSPHVSLAVDKEKPATMPPLGQA